MAVDLGTRQVAAAENLKFAPIFPIFPSAENHHADRRKPHWSLFANFVQMLQLFASWVLRESPMQTVSTCDLPSFSDEATQQEFRGQPDVADS